MKILNKTRYNTEVMRQLFAAAMAEVKKEYAPDWSKVNKLRIEVRYARRKYFVSGHANYTRPTMQLNIPAHWSPELCRKITGLESREPRCGHANGSLVQVLAATFVHELGHNLGVHHVREQGARRSLVTIEHHFAEWLYALKDDDYPLEQKAAAPAVNKECVRLVRYARALKNFDRAITRLKRAKTLASKWQQKIKYYERALGPVAVAAKTMKGKN